MQVLTRARVSMGVSKLWQCGSSGISGGIFIEDSKITDAPIRRGRGESVTRGDRRRRELGLQSPSPPLTRPLRIHGAMTL